jgi:hypothetical protein
MIRFEINDLNSSIKAMNPNIDFDVKFKFYYDETNNIRKFYLKESGFNYSIDSNFVLGGIVFCSKSPDFKELYNLLNLQKSIKEMKFRHIAKGDFIECLKSDKLTIFFKYLLKKEVFVHYSILNLLYFSIVDIVDSAIVNSNIASKLGQDFAFMLKNDLYKLCMLEIDILIQLFNKYQYPDIKKEDVIHFTMELIYILEKYANLPEYHFGLTSLKQIFKESVSKESLPFIMDEDAYVLLKDFSAFYLRPLYTFKFAEHIFDNEDFVKNILEKYELVDDSLAIQNYKFEDSKQNLYIQISDVFVGFVGQLTKFINTHTKEDILRILTTLDRTQKENLKQYFLLIDKSEQKNSAFFHNVTSVDDMGEMRILYEISQGEQ